jgi:hypothetical protein
MLEHIHFLGFGVNRSDFKMNANTDDGGRYKVTFSNFDFESEVDDNGENTFRIFISPKVCGYPEGDDEPAPDVVPTFEVNLDLTLAFNIATKDFKIEPVFYKDNAWFFRTYITTATKLATESLLKFTPMHEISMPWVVPD